MISKMGAMVALSPNLARPPRARWLQRAILTAMMLAFAAFILLTVKVYYEAPPIPIQVTNFDGSVLFSGDQIRQGQQIILKYGLMDKAWIGGHKTVLGPDFSTAYLQLLARHGATRIAQQRYGVGFEQLLPEQRASVVAQVRQALAQNHYNPKTGVLTLGPAYGEWFRYQSNVWQTCFSNQIKTGGMRGGSGIGSGELMQLNAFVGWSVWASAAHRASEVQGDHKNFVFDPAAEGRRPQTQYCG